VHDALSDVHFPVQVGSLTDDDLRARVERYESVVETMAALFATGGAWADDPTPFREAMERVGQHIEPVLGHHGGS